MRLVFRAKVSLEGKVLLLKPDGTYEMRTCILHNPPIPSEILNRLESGVWYNIHYKKCKNQNEKE